MKRGKKSHKIWAQVKPLLPAVVLSLLMSFIFFIFEPIVLYANNTTDFWFDLYDLVPILIPEFFVTFIVATLSLTIVYIFCAKLIGKVEIYYYLMAILFGLFTILYIQGNFLAGSLPSLNGATYSASDYTTEVNVSIVMAVIVLVVLAFCIYKFKIAKCVKVMTWVGGGVMAVLVIALISTLITTSSASMYNKNTSVATFDHYNDASRDRNYFILMMDTIDSMTFKEVLEENPEIQTTLQDFTYYPDLISYYPFTLYSMPYIFSQMMPPDEGGFTAYSEEAFASSPLLKRLRDGGYQVSMYDYNLVVDGETASHFANMAPAVEIDQENLLRELNRYFWFKYLPYSLKEVVNIEESNFYEAAPRKGAGSFRNYNMANYNIYDNEQIELIDDKVFHFIHLEGAHRPFDLDENLDVVRSTEQGTYQQKVAASAKIIQAYVERLKEAGVYDNASIIIMSDHGYEDIEDYKDIAIVENEVGCFNSLLLVKGVDEHHDKLIVSDKPISQADFGEMYEDLYLGKPSTELFSEIAYPRTRQLNVDVTTSYDGWKRFDEYETSGPAWDASGYKATGKTYALEP